MISIITFLYYFILFYGCKYSGFNKFHEDFLNIKKMNALKGFSSLSIILGHLCSNCPDYAKKYLIQTPYGLISIYPAFFFFCSGYGLIKSFKNKNNYLTHFIKKKLIQIIIPFYLSNFITILYRFYVFYDKTKLLLENIENQLILGRLLLYIPVTIVFWYMIELILLYLLFYITFKYINNKNLSKLIILAICWFLFLIPTHFHPKLYYHYAFIRKEYHISIYSFVYGLYIGDYEEKIVKFIKKFYYFFFVILIFFPFWFNLINNLEIYPQKIKYLNYFFEYTKYNLLSIIIFIYINNYNENTN